MAEPTREALEEHLYSLELRPAQLRRDPYGDEWLGQEWRALVATHPELIVIVRRFVEEELELYDSVRGQADAFFTARVIEATSPEEIAGAGLAPRYRSWVLACAYAMAFGVAVMIAAPWLKGQGYASWSAVVHDLVSHELGEARGDVPWLALAVAAVVLAVVAVATRRSGRDESSVIR